MKDKIKTKSNFVLYYIQLPVHCCIGKISPERRFNNDHQVLYVCLRKHTHCMWELLVPVPSRSPGATRAGSPRSSTSVFINGKNCLFFLFIYKISLHQAYKKNQIEHHRSLLRLHLGGCSRPPLGRSLGAMVEHAQKGWNTFVTGLLCCVKLLQTGRSCLFKTRGSLPELVYINQISPSLRIQKS